MYTVGQTKMGIKQSFWLVITVLCHTNFVGANNCSEATQTYNLAEYNGTGPSTFEVWAEGGTAITFLFPLMSKSNISNKRKKDIQFFLQEKLGQTYRGVEVYVEFDCNKFMMLEIRDKSRKLHLYHIKDYTERLLRLKYPLIFSEKPRNVLEANNCTEEIQNCSDADVTRNKHPTFFLEEIGFTFSISMSNITSRIQIQLFLYKNLTQKYSGVQVFLYFDMREQVMAVHVRGESGMLDLFDTEEYTRKALMWKYPHLFTKELKTHTKLVEGENCMSNCTSQIDTTDPNCTGILPNCQNSGFNAGSEKTIIEGPSPEKIPWTHFVMEMSQYNISDSMKKEMKLFLWRILTAMYSEVYNISVTVNMNYQLEIKVFHKLNNSDIPGFHKQLNLALLRRYPKLFYVENTIGKQGLRQQNDDISDNATQEITKLNCTLKSYNLSEYTLRQNGTIVITDSNKTYHTGQFFVINGTVFVCADTGRDKTSFNIVAMTTSCIAILCLLLSLVCLFRVKNQKGAVDFRLHACLLVALMIQMIAIFIDSLIGHFELACYVTTVAIHWTMLLTFGIAAINSLDILRIFRANSHFCKPGSRKYAFIGYSLIGISLPTAIIIASVTLDFSDVTDTWKPDYGATYTLCWARNTKGMLVFYVLPVGVAVVITVELLLASLIHVRMINSQFNAPLIHATKKRLKSQSRILTLMVITWLLVFLASGLDVHALWYAFVILNTVFSIYLLVDADFMVDKAGDTSNATKIHQSTDSNVSSVSFGDQPCI